MKYTDPDGRFSYQLQTAFDNHMDETYVFGSNDCDIWLENRINEAYSENTLAQDWGTLQFYNLSNSLNEEN